MKKLTLILAAAIAGLAATGQDNKPFAGDIGIGYGVSFFPTQQHVNVTYMVTNNIEVGGTLGFQYNRTRSSNFDSLQVNGNNYAALPGQEENRIVNTSGSVFITPLVKYHFNIKSNLDVYAGANLPIGVGINNKIVNSDIITANNYYSDQSFITTPPVSVTLGAGILLGCQYYFYKNLAIGAEANLGFSSTIADGNTVTKTSETNTGSNNPNDGSSVPSNTLKMLSKYDSEGVGMLHTFSLSATWYFERNSRKR